jgi:hypothetical protein
MSFSVVCVLVGGLVGGGLQPPPVATLDSPLATALVRQVRAVANMASYAICSDFDFGDS